MRERKRRHENAALNEEVTGDETALHDEMSADEASNGTEQNAEALAENSKSAEERKSWTGRRLVALIAGVAVASLLIGIGVMQFIVSPAELAARTEAPEPGPITAPVEERRIENTIITRGEVTYADAVEVSIDAAAAAERPVVTGHVPEAGTVFNAGNIALEVAGRPVIVLPGDLPAYRTLSIGMRGPDVVQLKAALNAMGYAAGDSGDDTFTWDTATAVGALYEQTGYSAANGGTEAQEALQASERSVRDANIAVSQAQAALDQARAGGSKNTAAEEAALTGANDQLSDAQDALGLAQERVLPTLPSSEVLFLNNLPRRVDDISVKRGDVLQGSPMNVSGAELTIVGTVSKQDAELLVAGAEATFPGPDGAELKAKVAKVEAPKTGAKPEGGENSGNAGGDSAGTGSSSRYTVSFTPSGLTKEQVEALRGTNVRVRVPVASTDGDVLAVPIAALSAGSGGQDRVELLVDLKSGPDAVTELIDVQAGLAADGFVEITSDDSRFKAGAKVVVGR
ncbi:MULTISPECIES: hypothetical protein [unclassified Leucobacter]|uniref:hypothetical protein n=1 Tax=unclassified Leucobacter TaxID=2621730 RepID=UPI00203CA66C|nr:MULTISPECIES: hypothetical protein [unclassified Leucobacter]